MAVSTFRASVRGHGLLVPPRISQNQDRVRARPRNQEHEFLDRAGPHRGAKYDGQRRRPCRAEQLRDLMGNLHDKAHIVRIIRRAGRSHADYGDGATFEIEIPARILGCAQQAFPNSAR